MRMPFGKYKGRDLKDIDESYLTWVLDNCKKTSPTLIEEIKERLGVKSERNEQAEAEIRLLRMRVVALQKQCDLQKQTGERRMDMIKSVHRELVKKHHPDRGGSTVAMAAINEFWERLSSIRPD